MGAVADERRHTIRHGRTDPYSFGQVPTDVRPDGSRCRQRELPTAVHNIRQQMRHRASGF
jgi:hypothetical protein